jgi:hypothetical protein
MHDDDFHPNETGSPAESVEEGAAFEGKRYKKRLKDFKAKYGQWWKTEAVNSMIERRLGSALRARSYWSQCREIILRVITRNAMIVARIRFFYGAIGHAAGRHPS